MIGDCIVRFGIMRETVVYCLALGLGLSFQPAMADEATGSPPSPALTALSTPAAKTVPIQEPAPILCTPATPPADKSKFEIFLLVGQSNMAGRAPLTAADRVADPRVLVLNRLDQWGSQGEPLHYDKPKALGVGPGFTFAKLLADKEAGVTIGLVPCAFGGTSLGQWDPRSKNLLYPPDNLYNNAIRRAKIALQSGTLAGILWHQGESDAGKGADTYAARLAKLAAQFRKDLNAPDVPFILGEIGYFNYTTHPFAKIINQQIDTLPALVSQSAVASADGLKDKGDHLHFDNASQKELARRFLDAFLKAKGNPRQ